MTFQQPANPEDWQTAYTINQAYRESGNIAPEISWIKYIPLISILVYVSIRMAGIYSTWKSGTLYFLLLCLGIIIIIIALFELASKAASRYGIDFFKKFHLPPETVSTEEIVKYRLNGRTKLPLILSDLFSSVSQFKYIIAKDGAIEKMDEWPAWQACNVGGPILLIIFDGCALYLERGNSFSRVVGPGEKAPFLEMYETIKYAVDLRPKVREDNFDVWTKDGINIKLTVRIECRIGDPANHDPDTGLVYPYDPVAIKKAIERYSLRWPNPLEEPGEATWMDAAWGQVTGIIPGYIGGRMLDDLLIAGQKRGQILAPNALQQLFTDLNKATSGFGVYVTNLQIIKLEVPDEVQNQQKENWKAERESIATIIDGEAKAYSIRTREKARAEAQRDLILAIADGLEKNKNKNYSEPLLLAISGVLDDSLKDPLLRAYLAKETLETLEKLQTMLDKPGT
jgi:regulator of protease activity HflC (stomatin/prohibitin superfamily)